jgi:hypothetical protein
MGNLIRCLVDGGEFLGRTSGRTGGRTGHPAGPPSCHSARSKTGWPPVHPKRGRGHRAVAAGQGDQLRPDRTGRAGSLGRAVAAIGPGVRDPGLPAPVLDACGLDEKTESGRFLVPFGELLGRIGVEEACIVQHMGHNGERARGDSGLLGWPDANWKIVRKDRRGGPSTRYFSAFGPGRGRAGVRARVQLDDRGAQGDRRQPQGRDARAAIPVILEVLTEKPKLSMRRIEEELAESDLTRGGDPGGSEVGRDRASDPRRGGAEAVSPALRSALVRRVRRQCAGAVVCVCAAGTL